MYGSCYRRRRPVDDVIELVGLGAAGRPPRRRAVGRAAPTARPRARHRRHPGAAVPRRADDRLRSGGPPQRVVADPPAVLRRHDRPADDALPRRGRAPGRSSRRARRRPAGRRGQPGRRWWVAAATRVGFRATARRGARRPGRRRCPPTRRWSATGSSSRPPRRRPTSTCSPAGRRARRRAGWADGRAAVAGGRVPLTRRRRRA